jgi:hypothetical protein
VLPREHGVTRPTRRLPELRRHRRRRLVHAIINTVVARGRNAPAKLTRKGIRFPRMSRRNAFLNDTGSKWRGFRYLGGVGSGRPRSAHSADELAMAAATDAALPTRHCVCVGCDGSVRSVDAAASTCCPTPPPHTHTHTHVDVSTR